MKNRQALVRGWFLKADSDLADARRTIASEGPYDTACFHAQQAAEKYLKGYLAWLGNPIPRAHDLEELQRLSVELESWAELSGLDLTELTAYAVELRYDAEFWPPQSTAEEAVELAQRVRACVLAKLPPDVRP
ncbi:HEPN domain-containing protein [Nitrospiraceae bacterium AH_259_D15_M11_P09]|nr:HEPN domain-containing protein [Nitrospiraceae bacterium AH_259_D15_M11_P09]